MHPKTLQSLLSDELTLQVGFLTNPKIVLRHLRKSPIVSKLVDSLRSEEVLESDVERFVQSLLSELKPQCIFHHELPLCAIAVALEGRATDFANDYINHLADLNIQEIIFAPKLAGIVRKQRHLTLDGSKNSFFDFEPKSQESYDLAVSEPTTDPEKKDIGTQHHEPK